MKKNVFTTFRRARATCGGLLERRAYAGCGADTGRTGEVRAH